MKKRICGEIKCINHMIKRRISNSTNMRKMEELTGDNAFIIGFLKNNQDKEIFQKDIESKFSITKSTTSKILKIMEQKDLINRLDVANDKRLKKITLTDKSRSLSIMIEKEIAEVEEKLLFGFNKEEMENLKNYFERMKENLKEENK